MTCNVTGCNNPEVAVFLCRIKMEKTGKLEDHEVKVCSSHEKAFETLGKKDEERFFN
jgi:hypothetical protein